MRNMRRGRRGMKEEGEEKEKINGAKRKQGQDEIGPKKGGDVGRNKKEEATRTWGRIGRI